MLIDYLREKFNARYGNIKVPKEELDRMFRQFLWEEEEMERTKMLIEAKINPIQQVSYSPTPGGVSSSSDDGDPFISVWDPLRNPVTGSGFAPDPARIFGVLDIGLPLLPTGTYDFTVDWGDGTSDRITSWNQPEIYHTYPSGGEYTVTIRGTIRGWQFYAFNASDRGRIFANKFLNILRWGCLRFVDPLLPDSGLGFFSSCRNLNFPDVVDTPNFEGITSLENMFRGRLVNLAPTTSPNYGKINEWGVSGITNMKSMFRDNPYFDQNIGAWDVSNVTNMSEMFLGYTDATLGNFNNGGSPDIGNWDTSSCTNMSSMFYSQKLFNQNIGNWDVSNVTNMDYMFRGASTAPYGSFNNGGSDSIKDWNTSNVTRMDYMFIQQPSFNQPVIGYWDVGEVVIARYMFGMLGGAYSVFNNGYPEGVGATASWNTSKLVNAEGMFFYNKGFNQNIGGWDVSSLQNANSMFSFTTFVNISTFNNGGSNSINSWNTSSLQRFANMFRGASAFNQPIGGWDIDQVGVIPGGTNLTGLNSHGNFMQYKTFSNYSTANMDALLNGWAAQPVLTSRNISFGPGNGNNIKRSAAGTPGFNILAGSIASGGKGWTFVGAGL